METKAIAIYTVRRNTIIDPRRKVEITQAGIPTGDRGVDKPNI